MTRIDVSIIVPIYRPKPWLDKVISALVSQTLETIEVLIVVDGPDLNAESVLKSFSDDRLRIFRLKQNMGVAYARNLALDNSRGKYIAFCDADDIWNRDKLKLQLSFMQDNHVDFSYTNYRTVDFERQIKIANTKRLSEFCDYRRCLLNNPMITSSIMIKKEIIGSQRMALIKNRQDLTLWLKILRNSKISSHLLDENLLDYSYSKNSLSSNKIGMMKYHFIVYRNHENYNFIVALLLTAIYSTLWFYRSKITTTLRND
jgi:teichuronic acid biosynthesis glycosyltransferase TuaG